MHTNGQSNQGRPVSFAAMVFDRMRGDGEPWPTSSSQVPGGTRDARSAFLDRLRAQQQQQPQRARERESLHMHDVPLHLRVPPTGQSGSTSSRTAGGGMSGTDGPGARPFGFVSLLRGQGSDTSMSSSSSSNMVIDEVGSSGRRLGGTSGGHGSGSGSGSESGLSFLDVPTLHRRESVFGPVLPSSGTLNGGGGPVPPLTMVISNSTEPTREWRNVRGYDGLLTMESSRSSSSASSSSSVSLSRGRPMSRVRMNEESPFEEYMFGWNLGTGQSYSYWGESTRRGSGDANSGV